MESIQQLQKKLEEAKKQDLLNQKIKTLSELRNQYEGKAFGSRTFERASKSPYDSAVFFKSIYMEGDKILVDEWYINRYRMGKDYKFSSLTYSYSRGRRPDQCLTSDHKNEYAVIHDKLPYHYKEIPVDKFMNLFNSCSDADISISRSFESIQEGYTDLIMMGDSTNESRIQKGISIIGLDIIDMFEHKKVWEEIKYSDLPMFQNQRWLPKLYARKILEYQVELWRAEQRDAWCSIRSYNALQYRIEAITPFIQSLPQ